MMASEEKKAAAEGGAKTRKVSFKAKNNTGMPKRRRCGMVFTPTEKTYETTPEILEKLKKDVHLVIKEIKA